MKTNSPISSLDRHRISLLIARWNMGPIIELHERDDFAGAAALDDKVDNFLRKPAPDPKAIGAFDMRARVKDGSHCNLGMNSETRQGEFEQVRHFALWRRHERLGTNPERRLLTIFDRLLSHCHDDQGQPQTDNQERRESKQQGPEKRTRK